MKWKIRPRTAPLSRTAVTAAAAASTPVATASTATAMVSLRRA
jgi:hypothetical protein